MAGLLTLGLKIISLNWLAFALFASTFYGEAGEYFGPRLFASQQSSCRISLGYLSCFIFGQVFLVILDTQSKWSNVQPYLQ